MHNTFMFSKLYPEEVFEGKYALKHQISQRLHAEQQICDVI